MAVLVSGLFDVNAWYLFAVAVPLFLPVLLGVHAYQRERAGRIGNAGFVLAFTGAALTSVALIVIVIGDAVLGIVWEDAEGIGVTMLVVSAITGAISLVVGFMILGIAMIRANMLPRLAPVLLLIGIPLALAIDIATGAFADDTTVPVGFFLGVPLFALGLAWIGYALWSSVGPDPARPPSAVEEQRHRSRYNSS
jgi:hypothetical protein